MNWNYAITWIVVLTKYVHKKSMLCHRWHNVKKFFFVSVQAVPKSTCSCQSSFCEYFSTFLGTHCAHKLQWPRASVIILNNVGFETTGISVEKLLIVKWWFSFTHSGDFIILDTRPATPLFKGNWMALWHLSLKLTSLSLSSIHHCYATISITLIIFRPLKCFHHMKVMQSGTWQKML